MIMHEFQEGTCHLMYNHPLPVAFKWDGKAMAGILHSDKSGNFTIDQLEEKGETVMNVDERGGTHSNEHVTELHFFLFI